MYMLKLQSETKESFVAVQSFEEILIYNPIFFINTLTISGTTRVIG